jgi:hypothetical protein
MKDRSSLRHNANAANAHNAEQPAIIPARHKQPGCAMSTWAIVLGAGLLLLLALVLAARLIASDDHHEPF